MMVVAERPIVKPTLTNATFSCLCCCKFNAITAAETISSTKVAINDMRFVIILVRNAVENMNIRNYWMDVLVA